MSEANLYNGDGLRTYRSESGATQRYIWDVRRPAGDPAGLGRQRLRLRPAADPRGRAAGVTYYQQDGLGSTVLTTDASGASTGSYAYDVYGAPRSATPAFAYTGQQLDASNLLYLRARSYDPSTGRFGSVDPVPGEPSATTTQGRFAYAGDAPIGNTDPSGLVTLSSGGEIGCSSGVKARAVTNWVDINGLNPLDWKLLGSEISVSVGKSYRAYDCGASFVYTACQPLNDSKLPLSANGSIPLGRGSIGASVSRNSACLEGKLGAAKAKPSLSVSGKIASSRTDPIHLAAKSILVSNLCGNSHSQRDTILSDQTYNLGKTRLVEN